MKSFGLRRGPARSVITIAALAAFVLFCPAPAPAQPSADCSTPGGTKGDGADIQCRLDAVLAKHDTVIGTMKQELGRCVGKNCELMQEHLKKIESAQARAKGQRGRFKAEDLDEVNKTRKVKCPGNKNCLETPDELDAKPETDTGVGEDLANQLDEIGQDLDSTNEMLSDATASAPTLASLMASTEAPAEFKPLYDYATHGVPTGNGWGPGPDPDYPGWLHVADNPRALIPTSFAMTFAAQAAMKSASVLQNGCKQSIFGTNTSAICAILDIVAVALDGTAKLLAYNLSDATAWDAKGAYLRAKDISDNMSVVGGKVATVGAAVGGAQAAVAGLQVKADLARVQLAAVRQRLIAAQNQIIQLLLTPDGRRSVPASMLTCDGINTLCPPVAISCSPTTGMCTFK